jgi:hypothetical protein
MRYWTIDEMQAERPCEEYTRERITELWAGRERLTLMEVLDLPIPAKDIVWVICRNNALTPDQLAEWMERIVTRAIRLHVLNCGIPAVEEWARNWLDGTDRSSESAKAARAATEAWEAAKAARAAAAPAAAWAAEVAAWEAAETATWAAGEAAWAAEVASWEAGEAATIVTERERQVQDCREILTAARH